ncbi:MAG: hypothetical protein IKB28_11545 [Clostridia bacterium]|nr:hypothetical protein [Clostridia bacterium]
MSKEYEVREEYGKIIISEHESSELLDMDDLPPVSGREKMGFALADTPRAQKITLTAILDIYGILYRLGSNSVVSVLFGILQILTLNFCGIFWIIDLLCIIYTDDIKFLGRIKYKDYEELKRSGKRIR